MSPHGFGARMHLNISLLQTFAKDLHYRTPSVSPWGPHNWRHKETCSFVLHRESRWMARILWQDSYYSSSAAKGVQLCCSAAVSISLYPFPPIWHEWPKGTFISFFLWDQQLISVTQKKILQNKYLNISCSPKWYIVTRQKWEKDSIIPCLYCILPYRI